MVTNSHLIEMAKDITVSKLSTSTFAPTKESGVCVAEFLEVVYNKLVELNNKEED